MSSIAKGSPVRWRVLLPLLLFRMADSANYALIFPYATDMITSFGGNPAHIGLWAGTAEGMLMLTEAGLATTWARLADKYGRKPVLLFGFSLGLIAVLMVGFSKSVPWLIIWRAAIAEITDSSNRAFVFSIYSPMFSVGAILGTTIGGQLAHPYGRLPVWAGGDSEFLKEWPYALPSFACAAFGLFALFISYWFLIETRPDILSETGVRHPAKATVRALLDVQYFATSLWIFCGFQFAAFTFEGVFSVYTYTSVNRGGLGLAVTVIGWLFVGGNLFYLAVVPFLLPYLQRRIGSYAALGVSLFGWVLTALTVPLSQAAAEKSRVAMWIVLALQVVTKNLGGCSWPMLDTLMIGLLDPYPEYTSLGIAMIQIVGAMGRAVGPSISGYLYSLSTTYPAQSAMRHLPWLYLLAVACVPLILMLRLPRDESALQGGKEVGYEALPLEEGRRSEEARPASTEAYGRSSEDF